MTRLDLVVTGRVVVAAHPHRLETAEAIGVADGRVAVVGGRDELSATPAAMRIEAGEAAVIPGLHDFHVHLVGLARSRRAVLVDDARDAREVASRLAQASADRPPGAWVTGRGWSEAQLAGAAHMLEPAVGGRPAFVTSHDGHSAWASAGARRLAHLGAHTNDPPGGLIERDASGHPTGILRETAMNLVAPLVSRLQGSELREPLDETLRQLAAWGITGASEAGDYTDHNGVGVDAALGDSYSSLTDLADLVDGRLRLTLGIPADAIEAAAERSLRTGAALHGRQTMRFGWAKQYTDGALGSGTAALFPPGAGIMRVSPQRLDADFAAARRARIGMALHAIGDRAVAAVLDAVARARSRAASVPRDRMEHVQLLRAADAARFAAEDVVASVQPIHAAADRHLVESRWPERADDAYAWRRLADAGALLAAGSDAPVESANPWLGIFAAVHRRLPSDTRDDWRPDQALSPTEAISAYTLAPALAIGATDEGHLQPGARADLAVLSVDLDTLLRADAGLADARSMVTLVDGREVHRS